MLLHCSWLPINNINKKKSILKDLFGFKKSRRNGLVIVKGMDKESEEFEIDRDKARESLRKLDEQLQSLSNKPLTPPKIRALDLKPPSISRPSISREEGDNSLWFSGSFLTFTASFLLVFTILYNIIFLTVIKPSVDGDEPEPEPETFQYADILQDAQKGAPLSTTTQFSLGP